MAGSVVTGRHGVGAVTGSLHLIHSQEAEGEQTGNGVGFGDLKVSTPATHLQEGHTSNPSQTVSPAGDQVFKYMSLWGHSHVNHNNNESHIRIKHIKMVK